MYKVIKTNKRSVYKTFNTLAELDSYATSNRYAKGIVTLAVNDIVVPEVRDCYTLNSYVVGQYMKDRYLK